MENDESLIKKNQTSKEGVLKKASKSWLKNQGVDLTSHPITNTQLFFVFIGVIGLIFLTFFASGFFSTLGQKTAEHFQRSSPNVLGESIKKTGIFAESKCQFTICENFLDLEAWKGSEYLITQKGSNQFKAPVTSSLSGWVMDYQDGMPLNFTANFTLIPKGLAPNVIFRYGELFKVTLGDSNYSRISVQDYKGYVKPVGYVNGHFNLSKSIQKDSEVTMKIESQRKISTNKVILKISITYFTNDGSQESLVLPDFIVNSQVNPASIIAPIGVGLVDPSRTGDIKAEFKSLIVQRNLE